MNFQQLFETVPWYVIPIVVFFITVVFAMLAIPRSKANTTVTQTDGFDDRSRIFDTSPLEEEPDMFLAEKRNAIRREGNPIPVLMSMDLEGARSEEAFVIDRSKTGLKIWTKRRIQSGAILRVRAYNAPDSTPWVFVQVCRVTKNKKFFELGCQFTQEVPWSVLLLFG